MIEMLRLGSLRDYIKRRTERIIKRWNHPVQRKMEREGWRWYPDFEVGYNDFAVYINPNRSSLIVYSKKEDKIFCESERNSLPFDRVCSISEQGS